MKIALLYLVCLPGISGCVQKAFKKTMIITLVVKGKKDIHNVGIRGSGNPLSWNTDYPMTPMIKDSVYHAVVVSKTAFSSTEVKFTVNGEWELEQKHNRTISFEKADTIRYTAI